MRTPRSVLEAAYAELLAERRAINARIKDVAAELALLPKPGEVAAVDGLVVRSKGGNTGVVVNRRGSSILVDFHGIGRVFMAPDELIDTSTPPRSII